MNFSNLIERFKHLFSTSPENVIAREHLQTQLNLIEHTKNKQFYTATTAMLEKRLTELEAMNKKIGEQLKEARDMRDSK